MKEIQLAVLFTVKKIAGDDEALCVKVLNLVQQALHIGPEQLLRNSDARFTEMACFTKMTIAYDKAAGIFPEDSALPGEP